MLFINIVQGNIWIIMIFQPAIQTEHYHSFSSSLHRNSGSMRRWSSRGVNSGRSFASLKHFWLRSGSTQFSVISLALTFHFFHFHFFLSACSHFWLRSGSAQVSVISLAGSKNSRGGQLFPGMIGPWTFGFDICIHLGVLIFNQYL